MEPRVVFMGTPEFALPTLERLAAAYPVVGVVTQPDSRAGRGRRVAMSPVKELALAEGIPVFQPERLRKNLEAVERIRAWTPDVIVVAAYGQLLPPSVLEIAPFGVINVHASLLPRWRGATPIQGAVLAGDAVTGVTIMKMNAGLDTGPVLAMREVAIGPEESAGELEMRLAQIGAALLLDVLPAYLAGDLTPQPQPESGVTITHRLLVEAAAIQWAQPAQTLHNHIRAFAPNPGAYTDWDGTRFKVLKAQVLDGVTPAGKPGTVFLYQKTPAVITSEGALVLLQVQMAGKRPMSGAEFVHGRKDLVGAILGSPEPGE
ncbi:MAG TPA: methionyl-tRNA formyltransferase [Anaerolineae bacterium]|nr:methionyl-tRNA formyltransferase [Anaerolineae bacterium]